jgi:hypothetical protein
MRTVDELIRDLEHRRTTKPNSKMPRSDVMEALSEIQHLIGGGLGHYQNDRSADRADQVQSRLQQAFKLCYLIRD